MTELFLQTAPLSDLNHQRCQLGGRIENQKPAPARGVNSRPIRLPRASVIVPAACFLAPTQSVRLENFGRIHSKAWWF